MTNHIGHSHDHAHGSQSSSIRALVTVLVFTTAIFIVELVGGFVSGSLALLSDAMHMLSDSTGLIVAVAAAVAGARKASPTATYGNRRFEVLAALINAVAVGAISIWIVVEAIRRFFSDGEVNAQIMLIVGIIGLVANAFGALVLHGHQEHSLNMRGAYLHVLVDLLGSVAVIIAAVVLMLTGFRGADTIASLIIAFMIVPRSVSLIKDALTVLLERVPRGVSLEELEPDLLRIPHVAGIHDLHVWSLDGQELLATAHVVVDDCGDVDYGCEVLDAVQSCLREHGIEHSTIQVEKPDHIEHEHSCD